MVLQDHVRVPRDEDHCKNLLGFIRKPNYIFAGYDFE